MIPNHRNQTVQSHTKVDTVPFVDRRLYVKNLQSSLRGTHDQNLGWAGNLCIERRRLHFDEFVIRTGSEVKTFHGF